MIYYRFTRPGALKLPPQEFIAMDFEHVLKTLAEVPGLSRIEVVCYVNGRYTGLIHVEAPFSVFKS